jgi:hypothetical protein
MELDSKDVSLISCVRLNSAIEEQWSKAKSFGKKMSFGAKAGWRTDAPRSNICA